MWWVLLIKNIFMTNNRLIRVQGRGKATQAPDKIIIRFEITQIHKEFDDAVNGCNARVEGIRHSIASVGLDPKDLKTTSFQVDHAYEYVNDKKVRLGYEAEHRTQIEFNLDKSLVARLMNSITTEGYKPKLSTTFTIHDREGLRCKVLDDAVRNATRRAEAIASSANLRLGPIQLMEHDAIGIPSSQTCYREPQIMFSMDKPHEVEWTIEPENLVAEASVLIAWELIE
jgi:uncharacterized protein YggE